MYNLATLVKQQVHFDYYRDGSLYYQTCDGFRFGVPVGDAGTGTFKSTDKAIFYMRWIRPAVTAANASLREEDDGNHPAT